MRSGIFHVGARGLFGLSDQATFASATFLGLFVGTLLFGFAADRFYLMLTRRIMAWRE